jgi:hypothetical protein
MAFLQIKNRIICWFTVAGGLAFGALFTAL